MSRLGKLPVELPQGVKVNFADGNLQVEGPKGKLDYKVPSNIQLDIKDNVIEAKRSGDEQNDRAMHGLVRTLVFNMVKGVSTGFQRKLKINGVGYRAAVKGNKIDLTLGFSHPAAYTLPDSVSAKMEGNTTIVLESPNKEALGQAAADIRSYRPPEPFKGKGVKYEDEVIRRKAGKASAGGK